MKKIKAVALVLIMILCGAAFARGMQVEAKANAVQEKCKDSKHRVIPETFSCVCKSQGIQSFRLVLKHNIIN